ncbi:uncharacterized protein LOC119606469 [Lucilia sericata]|uniref:uncharacterized protein LOC119606469 n=1 Tax=Lucilia sericata TaxID=13632 RepID=UPI0018A84851|nr:uncharacterized protein LOC119606469 [Lucilia sericata]XP_037815914.1 uncharacterized protein LOC119606469 [Lucilia sericata]
MNSNTVNVVYNFNSNAVIECEYKITTLFGKADRATTLNSPIYECFLKYENNIKSTCFIQNQHDEELPEDLEDEDDTDTIMFPINTKRLGIRWRKKTNMQKRKRHLMQRDYAKNISNNSSSCILGYQRPLTSRISITHRNEKQQQYWKNYNFRLRNSNIRSIISEKESLSNSNYNSSNTKYRLEHDNTENTKKYLEFEADDNKGKQFLFDKMQKRWRHHKHRTRSYSAILNFVMLMLSCSYLQQRKCKFLHVLFVILLTLTQYTDSIQGLLVSKSSTAIGLDLGSTNFENVSDILVYNNTNNSASNSSNNSISKRLTKSSFNLEHDGGERGETYLSGSKSLIITSSTEGVTSGGAYLDKLDNLERSLAAVLIKVAYGTTSTTKRSIPENSYVPSLTTIATPLLTTLRYQEKSHQSQLNIHHRNYELDLERDHALPTSAPNADILKSNSNPTYPNPNRHHNHDRDRHRHLINSTPKPSLPNILKKTGGHMPTISMFPGGGELPSYSPPSRSFFTPPLPPEYQHPFADKPTLRGTNNEGIIEPNSGSYINRRPIPPPSLMPGHERIPLRPPDLSGSSNNNEGVSAAQIPSSAGSTKSPLYSLTTMSDHHESDIKKSLNTPSKVTGISLENVSNVEGINISSSGVYLDANNSIYNNSNNPEVRKEVLPSIRRILSGSNGRKGDIPEVLLKQVTTRPNNNYHHPPSSPIVLINSSLLATHEGTVDNTDNKQNINKMKNMRDSENDDDPQQKVKFTTSTLGESNFTSNNITSTPSAAAAIGGSEKVKAAISAAIATSTTSSNFDMSLSVGKNNGDKLSSSTSSSTSSISSSTSSSTLASASAHATWSLAWNIHVYLSVILFTILAVYSFYKMITYNKLTHLFSQSYFICIHLILIIICTARTFYLCYDAYNIHSSFHIFISEILLNLPATFLTISFAVLILFLSLKSLNHKNNRYSALIRPLTVVVGCGVHVVLCITLHYVESYTLQNHQQHLYYQQQQQLLTKRQLMQQQQQQNFQYNYLQNQYSYAANIMGLESMAFSSSMSSVPGANFHQQTIATSVSSLPPPPPRVLSLICQIIYIFVCFSLGLLYLYLYRILKRILRSKSQNYIHGYQNLSYAIHITIATALLFVLLASLQIFGAISISSSRPLITKKTAEIDWLQWGYQFSLRLIEIAIITLISWVTGLKTSNGNNTVNINLTNNDSRVVTGQVNGANSTFNTNLSVNPVREKHGVHNSQYNHSNMTNFFLPCTSSSSQEQFDTDYPAVCNANTNLHTYTMRTGKLIYDDSFALNTLNVSNTATPASDFHHPHHQVQPHSKQPPQSTYQHPYDSQSLHSSAHHNVSEYGSRINYKPENHLQYNDYLTDNTTDHYENPNFDLRGSGSATSGSALVVNSNTGNGTVQKFGKNSISNSTTTASSSNNSNMGSNSSSGSSATLQQQMLLLHGGGDTCYSEPIHENYDFNNFEKPKFKQQPHDNWPDAHIPAILNKRDKKKSLTTLERCGYDKPERRSSNSTHSCNSNSNSNNIGVGAANNGNGGGSSRYASFNTFERAPFNNVRKSDTFNNITSNGLNIMHGRNNSSSSATSATSVSGSRNTPLGIQTLASTERHHHVMPSRNLRASGSSKVLTNNASGLDVFSRSTIERSSISHNQQRPLNQLNQSQVQNQYSDDDDDDKDDDIMLAASPHQV